MLSHRAFSSIWFLTILNRTNILSLNLTSTPSYSFFPIFCWWVLNVLSLFNQLSQLFDFIQNCWKLHFQNIIGKVQLVRLLTVKQCSLFKISLEKGNTGRLSWSQLLSVPNRATLKVVLLFHIVYFHLIFVLPHS